jgi:hypothetical protein
VHRAQPGNRPLHVTPHDARSETRVIRIVIRSVLSHAKLNSMYEVRFWLRGNEVSKQYESALALSSTHPEEVTYTQPVC